MRTATYAIVDTHGGVREAVEADLTAMLDMGRRFIEKAWARIGVGYCEESCAALLRSLMADHILLVAPDLSGMIGVMVHPWHFNRAAVTATELFWWSDGSHGAALLNEAERRLRAMGIPTLNMACEHHMRSAALDRLYRLRGFVPSEHIYIKDLR